MLSGEEVGTGESHAVLSLRSPYFAGATKHRRL